MIKFFDGLWRRVEGNKIRSFTTYADALANVHCWEENISYTSEDLVGLR